MLGDVKGRGKWVDSCGRGRRCETRLRAGRRLRFGGNWRKRGRGLCDCLRGVGIGSRRCQRLLLVGAQEAAAVDGRPGQIADVPPRRVALFQPLPETVRKEAANEGRDITARNMAIALRQM